MVTGGGFAVTAVARSPGHIALAVVLLGISEPISWTAAIHVARETVSPDSLSLVSAGASGGGAVGVVVNGIFVQTSGSIHNWKVSFWIALGVAALAIVVTFTVFNRPFIGPSASGHNLIRRIRTVIADPSGSVVIATSGISGVAVFTLATFLTATAIDEMGVSDVSAAALLWIAGTVGVASALTFGRMADLRTPTTAITVVVVAYASALLLLSLVWSYGALVAAVIGYGLLNGPVWGLVASMANRRFSAELAVGAVSAGFGRGVTPGCPGEFTDRPLDRVFRLDARSRIRACHADDPPGRLSHRRGPRIDAAEADRKRVGPTRTASKMCRSLSLIVILTGAGTSRRIRAREECCRG
jgi:predicted MFS family arabinose efflux permease